MTACTIVENTACWPLLIGPQLQGMRWVREKEKDWPAGALTKLERAIDSGMPVLLDNLRERIDGC